MSFEIGVHINLGGSADGLLPGSGRSDLPQLRERIVRRVARGVLGDVIGFTPVDAAELRASWVPLLERLGGAAPPGWQGPEPDGRAVQRGRTQSHLQRHEDQDTTTYLLTSEVDHSVWIEYGTRKMAARRPVRRALAIASRHAAGAAEGL